LGLFVKFSLTERAMPCHGPGRQSPACHRGDQGLIPDFFTWHLSCSTWHLDRNLLLVLRFPLLVSFYQCCILIFALTLLLSEGQAVEPWETLKQNNTLSSIEDHWTEKYFDVASGLKDR